MSIVHLNRNYEITHTLISSLWSCRVILLYFPGAPTLWRTHNPDVVFEKPWKPSTEHQARSEEGEKLWWRSHFHVQDLVLEKLEGWGKRVTLFGSFRADSDCQWLIDGGGDGDNDWQVSFLPQPEQLVAVQEVFFFTTAYYLERKPNNSISCLHTILNSG